MPTNATAVTGNLTIVGETADGLVALGPSMTPTGDVTTINFIVGDTRANNVTLGLGPNGTLSAVGTVQVGALPAQAPLHSENVLPEPALAVSVTLLPGP